MRHVKSSIWDPERCFPDKMPPWAEWVCVHCHQRPSPGHTFEYKGEAKLCREVGMYNTTIVCSQHYEHQTCDVLERSDPDSSNADIYGK